MNYKTENLISYNALNRSMPILEDFIKSYSIYHDLEPVDFLEHMDALIYVESVLYGVDDLMEDPAQNDILSDGISVGDGEFEEFIKNSNWGHPTIDME